MEAPARNPRSSSAYDRIFRENMDAALPGIIEQVLNLQVVKPEEIPDDLQHTKERKPDVLKKVTDSTGKSFILHLQWRVKNESTRKIWYLLTRAFPCLK